eukprot:GHVU01195068.1.p1 GENE.GHVU01195068.1~~GHVU01195068.1.p1  ORF type:complete len:105 (-),score=20.94 GHVU01195068.1:710-1024(-)
MNMIKFKKDGHEEGKDDREKKESVEMELLKLKLETAKLEHASKLGDLTVQRLIHRQQARQAGCPDTEIDLTLPLLGVDVQPPAVTTQSSPDPTVAPNLMADSVG